MKHPPKGHILQSIAAQKLTWKHAFGEWIDNALDARATSVQIVINGKHYLSVKDDGDGCSNALAMVIPGDRVTSKSTKLGRYGIGGKDSGLWVGDLDSTYSVKTIHAGRLASLSVTWRHYALDWDLDEPELSAPEPGERGTRITVSPVSRRVPEGQSLSMLLSDLGYIYSPALKRGAQISFQIGAKKPPILLKRWQLPLLRPDETVDTRVAVGSKTARVYCGILQDGEINNRVGLTYLYGYRVIISAGPGCGEFNPARICGFVELDETWPLTKNKDDIVDAQDLYEKVHEAILPVLRRAEEIGSVYASRAFENELTSRLRCLLTGGQNQTEKAVRGKGNKVGTVKSTNTGRGHSRAKNTQDGDRFSARNAGSIRVALDHLGEGGVGQVRYPTVILNIDNAWIAAMDRQQNGDALLAVALSLINAERFFESDQQLNLRIAWQGASNADDFSRSIGEMLGGMPTTIPAKVLA